MSETLDVIAIVLAFTVVLAIQRRPEPHRHPVVVRVTAPLPHYDTNEWRAPPRPVSRSFSD